MKETELRFRNKINWFTFLFSILVVWVHSYNAELFLGETKAADRVMLMERFLGETLAQIAVPGFFMISSFLFFRNFTWNALRVKWNSRIRSVLVPFIVWNVIYYLGYVVGSRLPVIGEIIGKGRVPFTLPALIDAIINYRYNYVFWYLFQLILLILLAPAIYGAVKRFYIGLGVLIGLFLAVYLGGAVLLLNLDALFYYSAAAFAAVHGKKLVENEWNERRAAAGAGMLILGIMVSLTEPFGTGAGRWAAADVLCRLLCPAGLWLLWPDRLIPVKREWMKNNFFLYAVHFAIVRLINKTGAWLLPPFPWIPMALFLLMPGLIVLISHAAGCFLKKHLPLVWFLLNGGR